MSASTAHAHATSFDWHDQGDWLTTPDAQEWGTRRIVDRQFRQADETRFPDSHMWPSTLYTYSLEVSEYTAPHEPGRIRKLQAPFDGEDRPVWHLGDAAELLAANGKIVIYAAGEALGLTMADVPRLIHDGSLITIAKAAELLDLMVAGIRKLIQHGDLTPVARCGWPVFFPKAAVLALKERRKVAKTHRLEACKSALALLFKDAHGRDVPRERSDVFKELRKRYSEATIYAAKRKLKIVEIPKFPGTWKWALPGTEIAPDQARTRHK